MAHFEEVELFANEEDEFIKLLVKPNIYFEDYEKCITWALTIKFMEHDTWSSDDFIHEVTHIIDPVKPEEYVEFTEKIKRKEIEKHARLTDAKVYVDLKLKPLQTLVTSYIRSDYVVID